MILLPDSLLAALEERVGDPRKRTAMASTELDAEPVDFDSLADDLREHGAPGAQGLLGMVGKLGGMFGLGETVAMGPDGPVRFGGSKAVPKKLAPPPAEAALTMAEDKLGFALPEELRQLYALGDGGFGPGDDGLFPLKALVKRYRAHVDAPFGPLDQPWPPELLPLFEENPVLLCLDLKTGAVTAWDPEEIEDEDSEADWRASFKSEQPSLAALLETWLGAPTVAEQAAAAMAQAKADYAARPPSPVTGYPMELGPADQAEAEVTFLGYSADLRADFGLPETGWEDEIRRRHGLL